MYVCVVHKSTSTYIFMPKTTIDYPVKINFRVSNALKADILKINAEASAAVREMLTEYTPIKLKMMNPMALPRIIKRDRDTLGISITSKQELCLTINEKPFLLDVDGVDVILANLMLHKVNSAQ